MSEPELSTAINIRPAQPEDVPQLLAFICELAEYEGLAHEVQATEPQLHEALFGPRPAAEAAIAELDRRAVGYALYFTTYSTFVGRPGVYLEDVYVQPHAHGRGIGRRLLAYVADAAVQRGGGRMEWTVLAWNQPSIDFYERLGARRLADWTVYRLAGADLVSLAEGCLPRS
jgi:GNAT superfamily N-acetyltransferase